MIATFRLWHDQFVAALAEARTELEAEEAGVERARDDLRHATEVLEALPAGIDRLDPDATLAAMLAIQIADTTRRRDHLAATLPGMLKRVSAARQRVAEIERAIQQLDLIATPAVEDHSDIESAPGFGLRGVEGRPAGMAPAPAGDFSEMAEAG